MGLESSPESSLESSPESMSEFTSGFPQASQPFLVPKAPIHNLLLRCSLLYTFLPETSHPYAECHYLLLIQSADNNCDHLQWRVARHRCTRRARTYLLKILPHLENTTTRDTKTLIRNINQLASTPIPLAITSLELKDCGGSKLFISRVPQ